MKENSDISSFPFLQGGGEMGELIRSIDWSSNILGTPENWPSALKIAAGIMLSSKFPTLICWGPAYIQLYNDTFRPINGKTKHPQALGGSARDTYAEIWATIEPMFEDVMQGVSHGFPNFMVSLNRNGYLEDCYFDFSYSPIKNEDGSIGGILVVCLETTEKVSTLEKAKQAETVSHKAHLESQIQEDRLRAFFMQAPAGICILSGPDLVFELVNPLYQQLFPGRNILGKPLLEALPELKGAPIWDVLQQVLQTGKTYEGKELLVPLARTDNGPVEDRYFDFIYQARISPGQKADGILAFVIEVTDKILSSRILQDINNEIAASNEEMSASNEELTVTNEELAITQQQLELSLASLTESEERFRTMAEGSGIFIAVSDETSNATYFNKEWMELTGRSMKDLLQFGWVDLVYPEDKERYVNIYLEAFKNKEPFTGEFRVLNKKGGYRWLLATGTARLLPDGSFAGYISSCIDITDRKKEEEEKRLLLNSIRDSETKLDQLINLLPASITVLIGEDFVIERTNPSNLAYWQRSGADVIGKPLLVALPELVDQAFPGQLKHVLDTGETIFEEEHPVKLESPDGSFNITYVDYSYQPLTNKDGKRIGVLVMSNDVTDKVESRWLLKKYAAELQGINKEAVTSNEELGAVNEELLATNEELSVMQRTLEGSVRELADSEARFRTMVQQAPVAISIQRGPHHFIESANDMMLAIVGKKTEEFVGKTYRKALPEISSQAFLGLLDKVYNTGETFYGYEVKAILKRDGQPVEGYYNFIYQAIIDENGASTGIMIVAIDVTGQVKARHQLQQAEEMLRMAVEAARIGSWYIEPETKALKYNTMLAKVFGYEGKTPMTYEQAIAQVGEEFRPRLLKQIESAIATGENYDMTYTHKRFNDGEIIWLRSLGKISPDDQGNYTIFSGVVMDVTEQKADEQRKNDFIGMVSHELKTPLTSLTAIVQVSNAKLKDNPDPFLSTSMEKATIQVKKMSNMINGFLNVSRLESGKMLVVKENFSLNELIEEIIKEHEITVTTHIIELNLCDHIQINADRDKIASVIANLISNAVKYSPKGKDIKVECRIINGHIQVSVKDEGMGIRAQDIQHVFDRYFRIATSHTQHISGFGIGLYLSAEIVSQHGGKIWAESESGVGSTFYFSLPLA